MRTHILEIGFGLGLNCLLCADYAEKHATSLSYTGIEHSPIAAATFLKLGYKDKLIHPSLANQLSAVFSDIEKRVFSPPLKPAPPAEQTPLLVSRELGKHTNLNLYIADATDKGLLARRPSAPLYDAIFLDAFSPDSNPECWTEPFLRLLCGLLSTDGRLATYCVKGAVRRNLHDAGFKVHKYPGPAGKREVLWASKR